MVEKEDWALLKAYYTSLFGNSTELVKAVKVFKKTASKLISTLPNQKFLNSNFGFWSKFAFKKTFFLNILCITNIL